MKAVLFIAAVFVLVWLLRRSLARALPPRRQDAAPPAAAPIVACAQCGVHLPKAEALPGRGGVFCSEPHRLAFERAGPAP